jgi:hypothetical protein
MPYLTKEEFAAKILCSPHRGIINDHILSGIPYAFRENPADFGLLKDKLAQGLQMGSEDITIIGSGCTGLSLDPDKFGAPFGAKSDIDVVVVNPALFDRCWLKLCALTRPSLNWSTSDTQNIKEHRSGNVFYGFLKMKYLAGILQPEAFTWNRAFKGLSQYPPLASLDINGRLYRTWDHVRLHQMYSLDLIKRKLEKQPS